MEERAKRLGISTMFGREALFGPLAHTRRHKQATHMHANTHVYLGF